MPVPVRRSRRLRKDTGGNDSSSDSSDHADAQSDLVRCHIFLNVVLTTEIRSRNLLSSKCNEQKRKVKSPKPPVLIRMMHLKRIAKIQESRRRFESSLPSSFYWTFFCRTMGVPNASMPSAMSYHQCVQVALLTLWAHNDCGWGYRDYRAWSQRRIQMIK